MLKYTNVGLIGLVLLANTTTADTIKIDIDGDGVTETVSRVDINGAPVLRFAKTSGAQLQVHGITFSDVADVRILPPTDLDGDGIADLVISGPFCDSGRVWMFSGGSAANGALNVSAATFTLQSAMPGATQFGLTLGLLPGSGFGSPACLRVLSLLPARNGSIHPRAEVYRFDTRRLIFVGEGAGALTAVWTDRADGNRDGKVDVADVVLSIARVGVEASFDGDLDDDGVITPNDVVVVASQAITSSADAQTQWAMVVNAMMVRPGGIAEWGMPISTVAFGPTQQPPAPAAAGTGVFYCARPIDGWWENWPWYLAPICHAYLQIGDWTHGFGGGSPSENPNDGRSRKCWEATRKSSGSMTVGGQTINCADATIAQIQQCVQDTGNAGGVNGCGDYNLVCNNCGDWVMDIIGACCLDGSYLPYLIY